MMKSFTFVFIFLFIFSLSFAQEKSWEATYKEAELFAQRRNFKAAISVFETALNLAEKEFGKSNEKYLMTKNNLGRCAIYVWEKDNTLKLLLENISICKKYGNKTAIYAQSLHNASTFFIINDKQGYAKESEAYLKEAIAIRKDLFGDKNPDYASSLNLLAVLYRELNNYGASLTYFKQALAIRKEVLGEKNLEYAITISELADLYQSMGNYANALPLYKQAIDIRKELLGEKNPNYIGTLNNLAILYGNMGNYDASLAIYKKILEIRKEILGTKHQIYIETLNNIASVQTRMGNYATALALYKQILEARKINLGDKHQSYAGTLYNLAGLYFFMDDFATALPLYKQASDIWKNNFGAKNITFINSVNSLAITNWQLNQRETSFKELSFIKNWAVEQINIQFPSLTEQQKEFLYNHKIKVYFNGYNAFAVNMPEINTKELYNVQLISKGILMQSAQKIKSRILNSKDSSLIKLYWAWTEQKGTIIKTNEMSAESRKEKAINLDSLIEVNENTEQKLSKKSEDFKNLTENKQTDWHKIKKMLKKGEAAIELVRINNYGVSKVVTDTSDVQKAPNFTKYPLFGLTDTVYYAALIIKKSSKEPEIVLLKNGNDLEQKFLKYQKNMIVYKREDELSYNEFWKPIAANLSGISKVYLSPDGVYNQVSLNTLYNPATKKYLLEEIDLHLVTNTKDLLTYGKKENKTLKAELLGYPIYDLANVNKTSSQKRSTDEDSLRAFASFNQVALLPGTKREVEDISKALAQNNFKVEMLLAESATEENIKKVHNPKILHISTHGFFIDSKEKNEKINPMLRSGLLLTGVTDYARMEEKPDTEDGVLTALEAANLDLDETDLVVLSACETGLGDVRAGEGVYGLQRAFKVAGAKTLVMSMWKVDDAVTQKLMSIFYQKYAATNNARQSFKEAQAEIKLAYPEPYYWGAFIMVGE